MTTQQRNHNGNTATMSNNDLYAHLITATTTTTRGIEYNRNQFTSNGNAIYTSNRNTITYNLNIGALNGILHSIASQIEKTSACSNDVYFMVATATQRAIYSLDILLSVLHQYKSNDLTIYNAFYAIMEQRQRLQLQLQFMNYCVVDQQEIVASYKKITKSIAMHNADNFLLRVWYARDHKKEIATATARVEKMQHGNDQRHVNNMQVLRNVILSLYQYAR